MSSRSLPMAAFAPARHRSTRPPLTQVAIVVTMGVLSAYAAIGVHKLPVLFGIVAAIGFAALGLTRPVIFLGLFLAIRPLLDKAGGTHVGGVNAAGALGLLLVLIMFGLILASPRQVRPPGAGLFAVVLLVSTLAVVPALLNYGGSIGLKPEAEIARLAAMLAVYVLAANLLATPLKVERLFTLIGLSGVIPALWGLIQLAQGVPHAAGLPISRISGPFTGPNPFALYLAVSAIVLVGLPRRALPAAVRVGALIPIFVALIETYSRAGWALFLIGFVLLGWRRHKRLVAAGLVIVVVLVLFIPSVHDRVLPPSQSGGVATPQSFQWRLDNWRGLLVAWEKRPITGYGLTTTGYVNPVKFVDPEGSGGNGFDAHNTVVKLLVEGGLVMLAVWVALIVAIVNRLRLLSRKAWQFQHFARLTLVLWIGAIVVGLSTDDPLRATATIGALLALVGALEGAYRNERRSAQAARVTPVTESVPEPAPAGG